MGERVVLDTNFLVYCVKYKIDLESELKRIIPGVFRVFVLDKTLDELGYLTERSKTRLEAKIALKLCEKFEKPSAGEQDVDSALVSLANKNTFIATQDSGVKKKIKTPLVIIRQRKYLLLENYTSNLK